MGGDTGHGRRGEGDLLSALPALSLVRVRVSFPSATPAPHTFTRPHHAATPTVYISAAAVSTYTLPRTIASFCRHKISACVVPLSDVCLQRSLAAARRGTLAGLCRVLSMYQNNASLPFRAGHQSRRYTLMVRLRAWRGRRGKRFGEEHVAVSIKRAYSRFLF
jgi:hypothetical protein